MGGDIMEQKDPVLDQVKKTIDTKKESAETIEFNIGQVEKSEKSLSDVWNPTMETQEPKMEAAELKDRKAAFDQGVNKAVETWNNKPENKENQISAELVRTWIFSEQLKAQSDQLPTTAEEAKSPDKLTSLQNVLFTLGCYKAEFKKGENDQPTKDAIKSLKPFLNKALDLKDKNALPDNSDLDDATLKALKDFLGKATGAKAPEENPKVDTKKAPDKPADSSDKLNYSDTLEKVKKITPDVAGGLYGKGSKDKPNATVKALQEILKDLKMPASYGDNADGIDGAYGSATKAAVSKLQKKMKDEMTGTGKLATKIDDETKKVLDSKALSDGNFGPKTLAVLTKYLELKSGENPTSEVNPANKDEAGKSGDKKAVDALKPDTNLDKTPASKEDPDQKETSRITENISRLTDNIDRHKPSDFIKQNPQILNWIAASSYSNNISLIEIKDTPQKDGTVSVQINLYEDGWKNPIHLPPSNMSGPDYNVISVKKESNPALYLASLKRAIIQGNDKPNWENARKSKDTFPKLADIDKAFTDSLFDLNGKISKLPNSIKSTNETNIQQELIKIAQDSIGIKFVKPENAGTEIKKVAAYLASSAGDGADKLNKGLTLIGKNDSDSTPGLPLLSEDRQAIMVAFLKDNGTTLKNIMDARKTLKADMDKLAKLSNKDNALPDNTKFEEGKIILPQAALNSPAGDKKYYKIKGPKDTSYNNTIDFNDCTEKTVCNVKATVDKDKNVEVTVSYIDTQDLGKPSSPKTEKYIISQVENTVAKILNTDNVPTKNQYALSGTDKTISVKPLGNNPTGSEVTIALDNGYATNKFENAEWVEASINSLPIKIKSGQTQQLKALKLDPDEKRQILKYTEKDDKHQGYIIFTEKNIITINSEGEVNIAKSESSDKSQDKTMLFLDDDYPNANQMSEGLSPALKGKIETAASKIGVLDIRKLPMEADDLEYTTKNFATAAKEALGIKISDTYNPKSKLADLASNFLKLSKGNNKLALSNAYKKALLGAFMQDNKEAMSDITTRQEIISNNLQSLQKTLEKNSKELPNLKINSKALTIAATEPSQIQNAEGQPLSGNILDLTDNSNGLVQNIYPIYKADGTTHLVVTKIDAQKTETHEIYTVVKDIGTKTAETKGQNSKDIVTSFFDTYGVKTQITEDTAGDAQTHTCTLNLSAGAITTKLKAVITDSSVTIYSPSTNEATIKGLNPADIKKPNSLLQFTEVRNVLFTAAQTPKSAAELKEDPSKLPPYLDATVKNQVAAWKEAEVTITGEKVEFLHKLAVEKLGITKTDEYKFNPATSPNLVKFAAEKPQSEVTNGQPIKGLDLNWKTRLLTAFLSDHGSQFAKTGQDNPTVKQ